jgi:aerobic-type carbon monoxide dehydrogenase small subunit (CoxS/CutS family)
MQPLPLELTVNGARRSLEANPQSTLLAVLRDTLDLIGTKYGCGEGQCGACTVLLDGQPVFACITPVLAAMGRAVETIEGVATEGQLHPLQRAFVDETAMQCGYCTPGMVMGALALLRRNPDPSEAEIVEHMNGHICRCGSYARIVRAVRRAAEAMAR